MDSKQKKVVVVTGGSGYVGSALRIVFQEAEFLVEDFGGDITDSAYVKKRCTELQEKYASLFGFIHAAAPKLIRTPVLSLSEKEFCEQLLVQVSGAFSVLRGLVPLIEKGGFVLGVTSAAIDQRGPTSTSGSYLPAKYALRGLLRVLHNELKDLRIYALAPGFMPDGLNKDMPKAVIELLLKKNPPDFVTSAEEVARVALSLASDHGGSRRGLSITVPKQELSDL